MVQMKKHILILFLISAIGIACNQAPSGTEAGAATTEVPADNGGPQDDPDLVAINETIHHFYGWYEANMETLANISYIKNGNQLDGGQLDAYYAMLMKTGLVHQSYVDADRAYLKNLEATAWKNENVEEGPLTGLDYDRFFCAQDFVMDFWKTAPVGAEGLGTDKVKATMSGDEGGSPRTQQFELVKENGKWLIAAVVCDQGN